MAIYEFECTGCGKRFEVNRPMHEHDQLLFDLPRFQADVSNTIRFTLMFLAASILLGFGAALLLDQRLRGTIFFQNVFLFPMAVSFVVTGTVWSWLIGPYVDAWLKGWLVRRARRGVLNGMGKRAESAGGHEEKRGSMS